MEKNNLNDLVQSKNKFNILARTLINLESTTIKELSLSKGQVIPEHSVPLDVTFFILKGKGKIQIGTEIQNIKEFDVISCPPNVKMSVMADKETELSFLNIKTPGLLSLK